MADDFLPVGVRALVKDVDKFLADLKSMQQGVAAFGQSVQESGLKLESFASAGSSVDAQIRALNKSVNLIGRNTVKMVGGVSAATQAMGAFTNALGRTSGVSITVTNNYDKVSQSTKKVESSTKSLGASLSSSVQNALKSKSSYNTLSTALIKLKADQEKTARAISAAEQGVKRSGGAVSQYEKRLGELSAELSRARAQLNQYKSAASALSDELDVVENSSTSTASEVERTRNEYYRAEAAAVLYKVKVDALETSLNSVQNRLTSSRGTVSAWQNILLQAGQRSKLLGSEIARTRGQLAVMGVSIRLVGGYARVFGTAIAGAAASVRLLAAGIARLPALLGAVSSGLARAGSALVAFNKRMTSLSKQMFRIGNSVRFFGASLTFMVTVPLVAFFKTATQAALEFESAFAGIVRTADDAKRGFALVAGEGDDIKVLTETGEALRKKAIQLGRDIPVPIAELARLGEVGGTLGIRGVAALEQFIDTSAKLGLTTNVAADEAGRALGKLITVTGGLSDAELDVLGYTSAEITLLKQSERTAISLEALGGIVVDLGNKTAAQEDEILTFARRIASTGNIANLASSEILAISSSFVSVGVDSSRGATAFQKAIFQITSAINEGGKNLEIFSKLSGRTSEEFVTDWETEAANVFRDFVSGLGQQGSKAVGVLGELELADARVANSLLALASADNVLGKQLAITNEQLNAQAEGLNALTIEFERRASTTASQLQLLKNQYEELGITLGSFILPLINDFVTVTRRVIETFSQLSKPIQKTILAFLAIVALQGPLVTGFGLILSTIGLVGSAIGFFVSTILSMISVLGLVSIPIFGVIAALAGLAIAFLASAKKMKSFAKVTSESLAKSMFRFGRNIIIAFARGMATAIIAVVKVLNQVGKVIAKWLRPGSPPKLLPDLDKWGSGAMEAYMSGWASADFGIFNDIADKIEGYLRSIGDDDSRAQTIETIIGSRSAIAKATGEIRKLGRVTSETMKNITAGLGRASSSVRRYVKALIEVRLETSKVAAAQEKINEVTRKYAELLRPIEQRLQQIVDRQNEVANAQRITELEEILADPRSTELARELATIEIEQIGLEEEAQTLERTRDAVVSVAEQEKEAAELRLRAAEEELAAAEAFIDVQIKNNELAQELVDAVEALKKSAKDVGLSLDDISAPELEFDFDEGAVEEILGDFGADLGIDSIVDEINDAFNQLIQDILAEFEPLLGENGLFAKLGETWAPIFDTILPKIQALLPDTERFLEKLDIAKSKTDAWAESAGRLLDGVLTETFGLLVDLGLIEPFGPLKEKVEETSGPISALGRAINTVRDFLANLARNPVVQAIIIQVIAIVSSLKAAFVTLSPVFSQLKEAFENISAGFGDLMVSAEPLIRLLGTIKVVIGAVAGALIITIVGIITAIINSIATGVQYMSRFLGSLLTAIGKIVGGITNVVQGIYDIIRGFIVWLSGKTEEGNEIFVGGWEKIRDGIIGIISGLVQGMISLIGGVIATIYGLIRGFVEGIIGFFENLYDTLVGNSIWPDMWNAMVEGILGFVDKIVEVGASVLEAVTQPFVDAFDWFRNDAIPEMLRIGGDLIGGLVSGIKNFAGDPVGTIKDVGGKVLGGIKNFFGITSPSREMKDVGEDLIAGLSEGIRKLSADSLKGFKDFAADVISVFTEMSETTVTSGARSITGEMFGTFIRELAIFAATSTRELLDWERAVLDIFTRLAEKVSLDGRSSITGKMYAGILDGLLDMIEEFRVFGLPKLLELFTRSLEAIVDYIKDQRPNFRQAGLALMDGLRAGINAGAAAVLAAARSIANQVTQIVNDAMGNQSPSKVFHEIGENIVQGWINGLDNRSQKLMQSVENLIAPFEGFQRQQALLAGAQASPQAVPARVLPASQSTTISSEVNMGGVSVNSGIDLFTLQMMIEQAISKAVR